MKEKFENALLVDDDEISNFITERFLKKYNIVQNINVALNGKAAIDLLQKRSEEGNEMPELILLDINMPVMDGFEFLEEVLKKSILTEDTKIIMLTSSDNAADIARAQQYSIQGYLIKPLTAEKLQTL